MGQKNWVIKETPKRCLMLFTTQGEKALPRASEMV